MTLLLSLKNTARENDTIEKEITEDRIVVEAVEGVAREVREEVRPGVGPGAGTVESALPQRHANTGVISRGPVAEARCRHQNPMPLLALRRACLLALHVLSLARTIRPVGRMARGNALRRVERILPKR